ncbi:hypothetical protein NECAME_17358 [Necator americanus]|uniref:Uncharacterized protein n=1 Tax=Necator americanus TaxID=51031 RepID=W2TNQ0_NECAM|nr:hypothetical protein NECAME_17358 [Necator americanus]ETN83730.1 hypothetical protein NECAME_17358 [Necator americanus]
MHFYAYSSSPSSSSSDDDCLSTDASPTKLLAIAIQKRRALFGRKERDYRLELLQTGFIQTLCKHLGERRARRRKRGGKRTVRQNKGDAEPFEAPVTRVEPIVQNPYDGEPPSKRCCQNEDEDPFGLDDFFVRVYGRSVVYRG